MTRAATIRRALATAIESAIPDVRAHADDRFRHLDAGSIDPDSAPDRVFTLTLAAQPARIEVNNCDTWRVEYTVTLKTVSQPMPNGFGPRPSACLRPLPVSCVLTWRRSA